ncbi:hypothetical protein R84981_001777 [Carnimonas sp. R-84981]
MFENYFDVYFLITKTELSSPTINISSYFFENVNFVFQCFTLSIGLTNYAYFPINYIYKSYGFIFQLDNFC